MSELAPAFRQQFFDANGLPLAGGQVFTYVAGTTTPLATYTDQSGNTPNTNPVILDSSGQAPIWMGENSYKFILQDSLGDLIETVDNIQSIATQIAAITGAFQQVTFSYTQLQTAGLSKAVKAFTVPLNNVLGRVFIKHSQNFSGGSISAVTAQVGLLNAYDQFISSFDIFQAVANNVRDGSSVDYSSFGASTDVYLNVIAVGANLSALTQGSVTIYYEVAPL